MPRKYTPHPPSKNQKDFVARVIREARLARDLSIREATVQAGVSQSGFMRWEAGESNSSAVRILDWLFHDKSASHDAFYWRERALHAEQTIETLHKKLSEYLAAHDEMLLDDSPARNRQTVPRRTAAEQNGRNP